MCEPPLLPGLHLPFVRPAMIKMVNVNIHWLQSSAKTHSVPASCKDTPYPRLMVEPLFHHASTTQTTTTLLSPEAHPAAKRSRDRRNDERYKTMPITFEEISEVDEELAACDERPSGGAMKDVGGRSPYSLSAQDDWFFVQPRPSRLIGSQSPQYTRSAPRLNRSFDLGTMPKRKRSGGSLEFLGADLLSLPSIPEAVTPVSPHPRLHHVDDGDEEENIVDEGNNFVPLPVEPRDNLFSNLNVEEEELEFDRRLSA